jgi:hypothetical protein
MKVDNEQENAYMDTENFGKDSWPACKKWNIIGWDLWSLQPGSEDQGYQYLTVQIFTDPVKWCRAEVILYAAKKAYPNMSDEDFMKNLNNLLSLETWPQDFIEQIDVTKDHLTCR